MTYQSQPHPLHAVHTCDRAEETPLLNPATVPCSGGYWKEKKDQNIVPYEPVQIKIHR